MPPITPFPRHSGGPQRSGSAEGGVSSVTSNSLSEALHPSSQTSAVVGGGHGGAQTPAAAFSISQLFAEALDGALALVRADGGELATLDNARQVLVLRARNTHFRQPVSPGGPGTGAAPSYSPLRPSGGSRSGVPGGPASVPSATQSAEYWPASPTNPDDGFEEQATVLLPTAASMRTYPPGNGILGMAWQRGEPVVFRGEQYRASLNGTLPSGSEAAWYLAVPIFRPGSLSSLRAGTEVFGVLMVFNRDPARPYTPHDVERLTLHADRVARALAATELGQLSQSQAEMLALLQSAGASQRDLSELYVRVRDLLRRQLDAPSFALLHFLPQHDEVVIEVAERDGVMADRARLPATALPPWWGDVRSGQVVCVSTAAERAAHPDYCVLGWGGESSVQSLLAAPLRSGTHLLGAIVAATPRPDAYLPQHAALFASLAQAAAIVIEQVRLTNETARSLTASRSLATQLAALVNAAATLNATLDVDRIVQALADQVSQISPGRRCAVFLLDREPEGSVPRLTLRATTWSADGARPPVEDVRLPFEWRNIGEAITSGQFLVLDHLDGEWGDETDSGRFLAQQHMSTGYILPLLGPEQVERSERERLDRAIGALFVYSPGRRQGIGQEEFGLLNQLASWASLSISNALLLRELEQALEQQKELDKLKDEFILTVSHEFRTPLTAIEGYMTLIQRHGDKLDKAKLLQFAEEIRTATSTLTSMINMLADANRMGTVPLQLAPKPVVAREAAAKAIATQAPDDALRIMLQIPGDLWVSADAERLVQTFSNLLSNAIKYSPASATCRVTARRVTLADLHREGHAPRGIVARTDTSVAAASPGEPVELAAEWAVLGVHDSGPGISSEDQERLFHKFVRLSSSLTTSVRGTGLGLWICRQYVEAMGGSIWVESEIGHGSHFQFALPALPAGSGRSGGLADEP